MALFDIFMNILMNLDVSQIYLLNNVTLGYSAFTLFMSGIFYLWKVYPGIDKKYETFRGVTIHN